MSKPKPVVGQRLFGVGLHRYNAGENWYVVTSIGRKYFRAKREDDKTGYSEAKFDLETWREENGHSPSIKIYASKEQREEEIEASVLAGQIRHIFTYGDTRKLSLETLRKIKAILHPQPAE